MLNDLVVRARTVRRFMQAEPVGAEVLVDLVALARLSPSSANRQTLRFLPICDPELNATIFAHLSWAGYLPDWPGPADGERPAAYIVVLSDKRLGPVREVDAGIVLQTMVLGACERDLATCVLGSVDRNNLAKELDLPEHFGILYVLALGRPAESVVVEDLGREGDVRYWRDEQGTMHVPKRTLDELIVKPISSH
jgi:nitroreductase